MPKQCSSHSSWSQSARPAKTGFFIFLLVSFGRITAAQNTVHCTTNYYPVTGATIREIYQSLSQSRPWRDKSTLDGLTDWRVEWQFQLASSPGECRLSSFSTKTTITVTLPRWVRPTNSTSDVATNWIRYITALARHENGHAQNGLAAAAEQQQRVPKLPPEPDCERLQKKINELAQRIVEDYGRRDREYDERTAHGSNQGASLRGGVEPQRDRPREK